MHKEIILTVPFDFMFYKMISYFNFLMYNLSLGSYVKKYEFMLTFLFENITSLRNNYMNYFQSFYFIFQAKCSFRYMSHLDTSYHLKAE